MAQVMKRIKFKTFKDITKMTQVKDTCNRVGIHEDKRVQQVVAAVLQQSLGQKRPAKLKVG